MLMAMKKKLRAVALRDSSIYPCYGENSTDDAQKTAGDKQRIM